MAKAKSEGAALQAEVGKAESFLKDAGVDEKKLFQKKILESAARNVVYCDAIETVLFGSDKSSLHYQQLQEKRKLCLSLQETFQDKVSEIFCQPFKQQRGLVSRIVSWLSKWSSVNDLRAAIRKEYKSQWNNAEKQERALSTAAGLAIDAAKEDFAKQQTIRRRKAAEANWDATVQKVVEELLEQYADERKLPLVVTNLVPPGRFYRPAGSNFRQSNWHGTPSFLNHAWQTDLVELHYTVSMREQKLACKVQALLPSDAGALVPSWSPSTQCAFEISEQVSLLLVQPVGSASKILVILQTDTDAFVSLVSKNRPFGPIKKSECILPVRKRKLSMASYDPGSRCLCLLSRGENQAVVYRFDPQFQTLQPAGEPANFGEQGLHQVWVAMLIPGKKVRSLSSRWCCIHLA